MVPVPSQRCWLKDAPQRKERPTAGTRERGEPRDAADPERVLLCERCGHGVTTEGAAIGVAGSHQHTFVNPHGQVFTIRCFVRAPGCGADGPSSSHWTWFPGYHWQVVSCLACGAHLGWLFGSAHDAFHGLIADRLVEDPGAGHAPR